MEQVESKKCFLGCSSVTQIRLDPPADLKQHQTNVHFRRVSRKQSLDGSSTPLKSGLPVCVHATVHLPASVHVPVRCETRGLRPVHLGCCCVREDYGTIEAERTACIPAPEPGSE